MGRNNSYLTKLQMQREAEIRYHRRFTMQWCADAAAIAANQVFQRKGSKIAEFLKAFFALAQEIAEITMEDAKGDKTLEYTKARVDGKLRDILGDKFQPWDERYDV